MKSISDSTKLLAAAGTIGLAALLAGSSAASARTFTRCDADGDNCVRVHCDWDGDNCWREPLYGDRYDYSRHYRDYDRGYYGGYGYGYGYHRVCDADGDNCRWEYY